ncbi:MAG TPA: hypothetical protein VIL46_12225 [Gemmataceae bacterium]
MIEALGALKAERAVPTIVKVLEEKGPGRTIPGPCAATWTVRTGSRPRRPR